MNRVEFIAFAVVLLALAGCKIVENKPKEESSIPAGQSGDEARNAAILENTLDAKLLPLIKGGALPVAELKERIATDLNGAGRDHGNRGAGQGAAWNFAVSGKGLVVEAKMDTRARSASVDTDGDGQSDVTVQLGPVIRGTALRDVAPFYKFDDFRDQIEFAKFARALNDRIKGMLTVPDDDPVGKVLRFVGVVPLKKASDALVVTPIEVEFLE